MANGLTGDDIRGGVLQADDVVKSVREDLRQLAQETRYQGLTGDDRKEFLGGLQQHEYDNLKQIAMALGPKGMNALERVLREVVSG